MSSGVFMIRHVTGDTWFMTSDGKTHLIREGDRVAIYPPAIHYDPEIFAKPTVLDSCMCLSVCLSVRSTQPFLQSTTRHDV